MKKLFVLFLVLCLIVLTLTACSGKSETEETTTQTTTEAAEEGGMSTGSSDTNNYIAQFNATVPEVTIQYDSYSIDYSIAEFDAGDLSSSEIESLESKANDLLNALVAEFQNQGLSVDINEKTGEMMLEASVLFGGDSAELTDKGKAVLDKFMSAYSSIICNSEFDGFIKKTKVEGHIAPVEGVTYEEGLPFSEKRAKNVLNYCKSIADSSSEKKVVENMEAIGYSNSKPIKDASGKVDYDASRRVSFTFVINPEYIK